MERARSIDNLIDADLELECTRADVGKAQLRLLEAIASMERFEPWVMDGARDYPMWLCGRLGISSYKARRYINAARVIDTLPLTKDSLMTGVLPLDKVVELCRFATPDDEKKLISWAKRVTLRSVIEKADLAQHIEKEEVVAVDRSRYVEWSFDDDGSMGLWGRFPAVQGAVVAKALDRMAGRLPEVVDEDDPVADFKESLTMRRADALYALCSQRIADDSDPDRATVVVHAPFSALAFGQGLCGIESGSVIDHDSALMMSCDCRREWVTEDDDGQALGIGRDGRIVPRWVRRQLLHRDKECTFPGCEFRRFLHAHHIWHWIKGGPTELWNLVLLCPFHHKLVHLYGWGVELQDGVVRWFKPNGQLFDPARVSERAPPIPA